MNYVEYGKENSDVIILLHGGGLSWWNYKEVAERLQTDYHVVLPILDGHAGCRLQQYAHCRAAGGRNRDRFRG